MPKIMVREKFHSVKNRIGSGFTKVTSKIRERRAIKSAKSSIDRPLVDRKGKEKIFAALAYLYVFVLVAAIFGRKDEFIAFHAKQGLILLVLWAVAFFLLWEPILAWLALLFILVETIIGLVNVVRTREKRLPLIGNLV